MAAQEEPDIDTPSELELRPSQLDPSTIGVHCKKSIRQGARFGPLLGERLQEIPENTNPEFLLKVVDKDSKELVFYVDASDVNTSNWMRYIQGCKSPSDQNVIPQRDGSDIYLTATKDLAKGSELLVWFEEKQNSGSDELRKDEHIKTILICWGGNNWSPSRKTKQTSFRKCAEDIDSNKEVDNNTSVEEERDVERDIVKDEELDSEGDEFKSGDEEEEEDSSSIKEEGKYQFELQPHHTIKSRLGRKVFQCDICSGVYRHAFSLKRHYIRNHINYRYVSKADLMNCQINADTHSNTEGPEKGSQISDTVQNDVKDIKSEDMDQRQDGDINEKSTGSDKENSDTFEETAESNIDKTDKVKLENDTNDGTTDAGARFAGLFRCNVCGQLFDTVGQLKSHISHHPDIPNMKAYSCDSCDMKFTHKQNLMRHQAVHTGAKPYLCKFCGKKFPTATNQKRHERIHLGRRISCEFCSSSFTQSGDLKKHIRKLHPECFHECAFCGKYYSSESILEEHLATHEETLISNLEEATRRRHAFKVNMEQDMAESMRLAEQRPGFKYACTVCKKRFHDYANMCRHRRLAHQRHLLISKRSGKLEEEEVPPVNDVSNDQAELDPHSYFFANVARNIAENLRYFVEGGQDNLNNPDMHIKWKVSNEDAEEAPKTVVHSNSECSNYSVYNFPQGFEPKSNFHKQIDQEKESQKAVVNLSTTSKNGPPTTNFVLTVPSFHVNKAKGNTSSSTNCNTSGSTATTTSATAKVTDIVQVKEEPVSVDTVQSSETTPEEIAEVPVISPIVSGVIDLKTKSTTGRKSPAKSISDKSETKRSASPITVPRVRICSICHCIFHKSDLFQAHMKSRHKMDVNVDEPQSGNTEALPQSTSPMTSPTLSSPPQTPLKSPSIPFASYKTKSWDGAVAAIDLSNSTEAQMYDFNGALDLTSPTKKSPPAFDLEYHNSAQSVSSPEIADTQQDTNSQYSETDLTSRTYNKYTCGVCSEDYPRLEALQTHQRTSHANVSRDQLNLIGDFNSNWTVKPNPVGLLNVSTSQIPTAEDYASTNVKYTCTKCKAEFKQIGDLHNHIVECAVDYFAISKPHQPKCRLRFAKGLGWVSSRHNKKMLENKAKVNQVKKKVKRALLKTIMTRQSEIDADSDFLPRRRSLELLYNPSKHVRRREMTEVLDMHRCRGCGYRFATISLLERHIKVCTQKDRIKDMQVMKPTLRGSSSLNSLSKRHMCYYCKKNFTYIGGLKKHIFDICGVRKQIKEENGKLDQSWEDSIVAMLLARDAAQEEESYERGTRKKRGRRKNHRWGYGKKKKMDSNADPEKDEEEGDEEEDDKEDDKEDENRDDESVTSLVSKESVRTDTSNSNMNNDYLDDNLDDDDDDSTSGVLVIDIKDEEEEEPMDFVTEGLADQINGKVSPGVIRAHVEHLQHKDVIKPNAASLQKECTNEATGKATEKSKSEVQDSVPTKVVGKISPVVDAVSNNDALHSISKKEDDLMDACPTAMAARALIDLQRSTDVKPLPSKAAITYSTLKVPDLSARTFRPQVSKQPKKAKAPTEPKTPKAKSPAKQKVAGNISKTTELAETTPAAASKPDAASVKATQKTSPTLESETPPPPVVPEDSIPKGKKEAMKRKSDEGVAAIPAKKTLTRSKSKNASEVKNVVKTNQEIQISPPLPIEKDICANTSNKAGPDNSPIRIKTGSKVKAVTLTSPKVTSAAMKLIVPSPGTVSAAAGGKKTVAASKAKQGASPNTKGSQATANKEKAAAASKDKAAATTSKASPAKAGNKKTQNKTNKEKDKEKETEIATTREVPEKKTAKKGGKGTRNTNASKASEKASEPKPSPKKTTKRANSASATPDPTPPPSPAKKNPKRRTTRAS